MRAVIQRVASASVTVDNEIISKIGRGLTVLIGIGADDTESDIELVCKKIVGMKVFDSEGTMWKKSVKDIDGEILCVSQFTLMANTTKGYKPDFHRAMSSDPCREFYSSFLKHLALTYKVEKIKDGQFGAMMDVKLINEGPVTLIIDSRKFDGVDATRPSA